MRSTNKNQPVERNHGNQKNQGGLSNQTPPPTEINPGNKPSTMEDDTEETPDPRREYEDQKHQHEYITPKGQDDPRGINDPSGEKEQYTGHDTHRDQSGNTGKK